MGLRSVLAVVLAATLGVLSTNNSCQNSGIGTGKVGTLGIENFTFNQKITTAVPANTSVDQWDGSVASGIKFSDLIDFFGSFEPAPGGTLSLTTWDLEPWVICPGKRMQMPTVPPKVTIHVNPSNLTFNESFQLNYPACSGKTIPGINLLPVGSQIGFNSEFDGNLAAGTAVKFTVKAKF